MDWRRNTIQYMEKDDITIIKTTNMTDTSITSTTNLVHDSDKLFGTIASVGDNSLCGGHVCGGGGRYVCKESTTDP